MDSRQTILVTGGAGYIGSHACKALAQAGYTPIAYDNLVYGHRGAVRWGPLEVGDIADRARLDAVIAHYRPEAVMHFAAYAYVGESVQDPAKYYRNNVAGTLTLLEALVRPRHRPHRLLQHLRHLRRSRSGPRSTRTTRSSPINPYGASKLMVERMLQDFDAAYGLRSVALRYFNAAGADPDGEIGEDHDPETHLIPLVLQAAARPARGIAGLRRRLPDTRRHLHPRLHPRDRPRRGPRAWRWSYLADGGATTALNLGTGHGHSVREVIETARKVTGRDIPTQLTDRRPGDPPILTAAADKAHSLLGWQPRYTDLAETLRHAWHWHRQYAAAGWAKRSVPTKT